MMNKKIIYDTIYSHSYIDNIAIGAIRKILDNKEIQNSDFVEIEDLGSNDYDREEYEMVIYREREESDEEFEIRKEQAAERKRIQEETKCIAVSVKELEELREKAWKYDELSK